MRDGGKGDKQRPLTVDEEQFNSNWDKIFNKKPESLKEKAPCEIYEEMEKTGKLDYLK